MSINKRYLQIHEGDSVGSQPLSVWSKPLLMKKSTWQLLVNFYDGYNLYCIKCFEMQ